MNSNELKAQMVRKEKSVESICAAIGISRSAWFRKISGVTEFTQSEISALRRELDLDEGLTMLIFFDDKVS